MSNHKPIDIHSTITRVEGILASEIDNDLVLMSIENNKFYGLDPVSKRIWQSIEQPRVVTDVCKELLTEFNVNPEVCQHDVLEFVQELSNEKLVEVAAAA